MKKMIELLRVFQYDRMSKNFAIGLKTFKNLWKSW